MQLNYSRYRPGNTPTAGPAERRPAARAQAAEFWVFCADFNRNLQICPDAQLGLAEQLLLGCVDTAILAQNALVAAESLGLGGVYIGGLRNNIEAVTELLKLPQHVLPLFGLCLGWPAITRR
jgi:nitroreductase